MLDIVWKIQVKAAIKSITLTLKKGDEIVKTLNVSPDDLTTTLTDLQYYKGL